jgi:hypothetical protein
MFSLLSLFKGGRPKGHVNNSKAIIKAEKLFISSDEKPFNQINSTVTIPDNYDVSLFSARNDRGSIHKQNLRTLNFCGKNGFLQKNQPNELAMLSVSTSNMLVHSALVHKDGGYANFVTKTSKDKPFCYMSDDANNLKVSGVCGYELESGKTGYISGIIYRMCRTASSDNVFPGLQNDPVKLARFEYSEFNIANMIASYRKLTTVVYINKLVQPKFYVHYHLYDTVYGNYIAGLITKKEWEDFLD